MTTSLVRSTEHGRGASLTAILALAICAWFLGGISASHAADPPFHYVRAKAFHIPPETTTEESGYFSLCEGRNGRIYIGTAAYGRDSYLVEFDPKTGQTGNVLFGQYTATRLPRRMQLALRVTF